MNAQTEYGREVQVRRGLPNLQARRQRNEPIIVGFLGGSITEGYGAKDPDTGCYRALTGQYLQNVFGSDNVTCINAGVGGTTSTFGAHRFQEHVMSGISSIDLLFVEFSVNDGADREESIRGVEGIVRQCNRLNPQADICFLYTADDDNLGEGLPFNIAVHEEVAAHYNLPSVNFAAHVRGMIREGETTWEELAPDRTHPNDAGYAVYADRLTTFLGTVLSEEAVTDVHLIQAAATAPLEANNLAYAAMQDIAGLATPDGFSLRDLSQEPIMNWRYDSTHLFTDQPGAELTIGLQVKGIGVLAMWGPKSAYSSTLLTGRRISRSTCSMNGVSVLIGRLSLSWSCMKRHSLSGCRSAIRQARMSAVSAMSFGF